MAERAKRKIRDGLIMNGCIIAVLSVLSFLAAYLR